MCDGNREDRTSPSAGEANLGEWLTSKWGFLGWPEVLQMERKLHSGSMDNCAKAQGPERAFASKEDQHGQVWGQLWLELKGRRQPGMDPLFGDSHWGKQGTQTYFSASGTGLIDKKYKSGEVWRKDLSGQDLEAGKQARRVLPKYQGSGDEKSWRGDTRSQSWLRRNLHRI